MSELETYKCTVIVKRMQSNAVVAQNLAFGYFFAKTARLYTSRCSNAVPVPLATQNSA